MNMSKHSRNSSISRLQTSSYDDATVYSTSCPLAAAKWDADTGTPINDTWRWTVTPGSLVSAGAQGFENVFKLQSFGSATESLSVAPWQVYNEDYLSDAQMAF